MTVVPAISPAVGALQTWGSLKARGLPVCAFLLNTQKGA